MVDIAIKENTRLFIDLDETMVSSYEVTCEEEARRHVEATTDYEGCYFSTGGGWEPRSWYVSFLRPGIWQHLDWCRNLVGDENFFILTSSTPDYALPINRMLGLHFDVHKLYTCFDYCMDVPMFKETNNVLIDNEDYTYHQFHPTEELNKINFLHGLLPHKIMKVNPFCITMKDRDRTSEYVESWKEKIIEIINL